MAEHSKPKRRIPFWLVLLIATVASCVVMNVITILFQLGAFKSWISLESPPSGAVKILAADYREIWVETNNGQTFTACLYGAESELCPKWKLVKDVSEIPQQSFPIRRGTDCKNLQNDTFPFDPKGKIVECIYANFPGPEMGEEAYFALMADGSLEYWQNGGSLIATQVLFAFSTIVFPFLVFVGGGIGYAVWDIIAQRGNRKEKAEKPGAG